MVVVLLLGSSVAEQVTVNHLVAGSNPARAAIIPEVQSLAYSLCQAQANEQVYGAMSYDSLP